MSLSGNMSSDKESDLHFETASAININSNVEARIKNPLAGIPQALLLRNVEIFAREKNLTDELLILSKGAIRKPSLIAVDHVYTLTRGQGSGSKPCRVRDPRAT
jgi:hypothetical protein